MRKQIGNDKNFKKYRMELKVISSEITATGIIYEEFPRTFNKL